jgi:hypothetical protein
METLLHSRGPATLFRKETAMKEYKVVYYDNAPTVPQERVVYQGTNEEEARQSYARLRNRSSTMFERTDKAAATATDVLSVPAIGAPTDNSSWTTVAGRSVVRNQW